MTPRCQYCRSAQHVSPSAVVGVLTCRLCEQGLTTWRASRRGSIVTAMSREAHASGLSGRGFETTR
jgi:hypothetical protein